MRDKQGDLDAEVRRLSSQGPNSIEAWSERWNRKGPLREGGRKGHGQYTSP
jgi:hypothetical protein